MDNNEVWSVEEIREGAKNWHLHNTATFSPEFRNSKLILSLALEIIALKKQIEDLKKQIEDLKKQPKDFMGYPPTQLCTYEKNRPV